MESPLFKFPSINQFKQTVTSMKKLNIDQNITFSGTVKLHGTNAAVGYSDKHGIWTQSRRRIITPEDDNFKFAGWVNNNKNDVIIFMKELANYYKIDLNENVIIVYGEYCAGKIQKNVAISGLDLMFVIFDVAIATYEDCNKTNVNDDEIYLKWLDLEDCKVEFPNQKLSIYSIYQFQTYSIDVNLNDLSSVKNNLIELTNQVEKECPVGKYFGRVQGKDCTTGEGIVWRCSYQLDNGYKRIFRFKVKGDEHATSKVKTMTGDSMMMDIKEFIEMSVTENRLNQGIREIFGDEEPDNSWFKNIGKFNQWVVHDVKKEDMSAFPYLDDYEGKNGEDKQKEITKLLNKGITNKCTKWFRSFIKNS